MSEFNIRVLNYNEFVRQDLTQIFERNGSSVPNPLNANIQVAENSEGKIIGLSVLQPLYHAEPIYVDEEYRNTNLHKELIKSLLEPWVGVKGLQIFVFAPNTKTVNLAERFGFKELNYRVMVREF